MMDPEEGAAIERVEVEKMLTSKQSLPLSECIKIMP